MGPAKGRAVRTPTNFTLSNAQACSTSIGARLLPFSERDQIDGAQPAESIDVGAVSTDGFIAFAAEIGRIGGSPSEDGEPAWCSDGC
jgi:hypothetical protein